MKRLALFFCTWMMVQGAISQYLDFSKYAWQNFDTGNSEVPSNFITDLFLDDENSIWVSSTGNPLVRVLHGGRWEDVEKTGLASSWWMNDWTETSRGRFFIAGQYGYILSYNFAYGKFDTIAVPKEAPSVIRANAMEVVLIGCLGGTGSTHNLYQLANGVLSPLNDRFGDVFSIYIESNGDALVAFKEGLYRYNQKADGTYSTKPKKLSDHAYYEIAKDSKGIIWGTCMDDGYLHRYDGSWQIIKGGPHDLFCNFRGETRYVAHNLVILDDDRVMISTQFNTGIAVYNDEYWKGYKPELKSPGDGISRVQIGPDGSVWCGTSRNGLLVFRPAILIKPRKKRIRYRDTAELKKDTMPVVFEKPVEDGKPVPYLPDPLRRVRTYQSVSTFEDSIMVRVWDGQKIDGDTISLYCNGEALLKYRPLTALQDTFWFKLMEGENEMLLYAHNLGSIPPNTATIMITLGSKVLSVELNSDLNTCERLMIRRRRGDGSGY
ncbi:MAG: hypothetical protein ACYC1Q_10155 [Bacteroidia bacterium]